MTGHAPEPSQLESGPIRAPTPDDKPRGNDLLTLQQQIGYTRCGDEWIAHPPGGADRESHRALTVFADEVANARIDRFAPSPAAEYSIVPDTGHHVVLAAGCGDAGTKAVGGLSLSVS